MSRALVVSTYGDPEIAGAIVDGMSRRVYNLDGDQLAVVKAELARYKARHELRVYGDQKRLRAARREMVRKYTVKPVPPVRGAILGVYGLLCLVVASAYDKLSAWNRR